MSTLPIHSANIAAPLHQKVASIKYATCPLTHPPTYLIRLARELQAEMRHAGHAAARCGALPSDYASHRGLALASVLHRLHAAGAPAS